jgi:hypothetical protein
LLGSALPFAHAGAHPMIDPEPDPSEQENPSPEEEVQHQAEEDAARLGDFA